MTEYMYNVHVTRIPSTAKVKMYLGNCFFIVRVNAKRPFRMSKRRVNLPLNKRGINKCDR